MISNVYRLEVRGRGFNRWLIKIEERPTKNDPWEPKNWTDWTNFRTEFREAVGKPLLATGVVAVATQDPYGTAVLPNEGWLLVELTVAEAIKLHDSGIENGRTDIFGDNPSGKSEQAARGEWRQLLAVTLV
jgi:hypothetical protein